MSLEDRVDSLELMVYRNNKAIRKEMNDRLTALEEIIKHPIYVYNPNKETPKCQRCRDTKIIFNWRKRKEVSCPNCAPKTSCEHEWIEGYHFEECLKCKGIRGIEPKPKNCEHGEEIIPDIQNCGKCFDDFSNFEPKPKTPSDYQLGFKCGKSHAKAVLRERFEDLIITHGFGPVIFIDNVRELFAPNGKDE